MNMDFNELIIKEKSQLFRLEKFVEDICDYYNISNDYFGNIQLATAEAATILWAINESDPDVFLIINFERKPKGLIFKIKLGPSEERVHEREDLLDLEIRKHKLSRDIYIIRALSDEIIISVKGTAITLVFYVSSMNYEKSLKRISELKEYWQRKEAVATKK